MKASRALIILLSLAVGCSCSVRTSPSKHGYLLPSIAGGVKPIGFDTSDNLVYATDVSTTIITTASTDSGKVLVAESGAVSPLATWGTQGYVLTSNGPMTDPSFQAPIAANFNYAVCSGFRVTAAAGTPQGTGCTILIPGAGSWILKGNIRYAINATSNLGAYMSFKFRNITTGVDVPDSARITTCVTSSSYNTIGTIPMEAEVFTTSAATIEVYGTKLNGLGSGFTESSIVSGTDGWTTLLWEQRQ